MEFRILGPVGLWADNDDEVPLNGMKQRTLLAAFMLAHGQAISDHQIGELLWGTDPPETFQAQIYTYASRLRRRLSDAIQIVRKGPSYTMRMPTARFDYEEFCTLSAQGSAALHQNRYDEAGEMLRSALDLWRGPALADVTEQLAERERPALDQARLAALENRIEADLATSRHEEVTAELVSLVKRHPLRERFRAQLMLAHYHADRQADAFAVFHEGRQCLEEELGVNPGPALRYTYKAILTGDADRRSDQSVGRPGR
ncbi:AfsR/SARP family transcriptional regulator [Micromonospora sp. NBC_01405]|uniref:AfsR/SARP family transcriptional regulator n=1 Tax=Micromonospora sp. NBC_01405 TaxID=2903589 RepID=UPI00324DBE71